MATRPPNLSLIPGGAFPPEDMPDEELLRTLGRLAAEEQVLLATVEDKEKAFQKASRQFDEAVYDLEAARERINECLREAAKRGLEDTAMERVTVTD